MNGKWREYVPWYEPDNLTFSYRTIPAFGTTIRRFAHNVSAMKKMAARDFEDLLQVRGL